MKKIIVLGIVLTLALAAISMTTTSIAHTEDDPQVVTLRAGQNIDAGTVSVWNDGDNIYVTFETTGEWEMTETHLYVGKTDPNDLTSAPGQFPYSAPHDPSVTTYQYVIALDDIDSYHLELNKKGKTTGKWIADGNTSVGPDDTVYIAAHASLSDENTMILVSEPGIDVYGPLATYAPVNDSTWGTANPALATWIHSAWPSIPGATWISTAYLIGQDGGSIPDSSWRWFHEEFSLPDPFNLISATLSVTSDNAEEFYLNGLIIGTDGEVQVTPIDNHEWQTILTYGIEPQAGLNKLDFIVRNYPGSSDPESNPTGLIYEAEICYATGETAWGNGDPFGNNWATYFEYDIQWTYIETVDVFALNTPIATSITTFDSGTLYKIVASGTAFAGDTIDFDAKYSITNRITGDTWTDCVSGYEGYGPTLLDLMVNGGAVDWGAYNSDHIYEYILTGTGTPANFQFQIYDIYPPNNYGSLTVDIYEWA